MSKSLYTISYFSKNNVTGTQEQIKDEINDILTVANTRNSEQEVTGALLYSGGYFIQVLEGPEAAVEEIFESIQNDFRHRDIVVIRHGHIDKRSFSEWSMALAGVDEDLIPGLEGILAVPDDIVASPTGIALVKLLTDLLKRYEEEM